jgi:hypothetical protein
MSSNDFVPKDSREKYAVVLPCEPEDFREFISGLLGKPQTITKYIAGPFELTKHDIENFYHLVVQRVSQQNEATLIQFSITIKYDDNSTVLLNGLDDFLRYHEVRPITSTAATLSWTFLVRFQDRRVFEKQQIDVSINAAHEEELLIEGMRRITSHHKGSFNFRISHTARTWGADIEALLTGHIENLIKKLHPLKKFITKNSAKIGLGVGVVSLLSSMAACFYTTQVFLSSKIQEVRALQSADARLDYAVNLMAAGAWARFFFYIFCFLLLALVISTVLGIWAGMKADTQEPSFLLLSKQAEKAKQQQVARNKRDWLLFALSLMTSVVTGVVGNSLFAIFLQKWLSR